MHPEIAVVLGPGGPVGTAWLAGLAAGLRRAGVDLGSAGLIVGTSAGAVVGAVLAGGGDLERLAAPRPAAGPGGGVRTDPGKLGQVLATLGGTGLDRAEALRRVGQLAIAAATGTEDAAVARMRSLLASALARTRWPDRPLLIPVVDAESGEPAIWDRHGQASLPEAMAASTAFPATSPPITVGGRRYIDGALRAGANVDLAAHARVLIVAEPAAHVFGPSSAAAAEGTVIRLAPDAAAIRAFGPQMTAYDTWERAYQAGIRQAPDAAGAIRARRGGAGLNRPVPGPVTWLPGAVSPVERGA
jgi:NTE family protein